LLRFYPSLGAVFTGPRTSLSDPLHFIRECVRKRRVLWTYHVNMRLEGRFIPRESILDSLESYEIIESYPEDR
jgi:uncharacterized protein DUF4258